MSRQAITASVERLGRAALGAKWFLVSASVRAHLSAMPEEELRRLAGLVVEEAEGLRRVL